MGLEFRSLPSAGELAAFTALAKDEFLALRFSLPIWITLLAISLFVDHLRLPFGANRPLSVLDISVSLDGDGVFTTTNAELSLLFNLGGVFGMSWVGNVFAPF